MRRARILNWPPSPPNVRIEPVLKIIDKETIEYFDVRYISEKSFRVMSIGDLKNHYRIVIPLTSGKDAVLILPKDITEFDLQLIAHAIEGIRLRLKFDSDEQRTEH
jgi:hypothetical protein